MRPVKKIDLKTDIWGLLLVAAAPFLVYSWTLPQWWIASDDPVLLAFAAEFSFLEYTTNPDIWRLLTNSNLTPLVVWLYDLDMRLFGLEPEKFFIHNLATGSILGCAAYCLARFFTRPWIAAFLILLFFLSPAFAHAIHYLMLRHYLEGLVWALFCIFSFRYALVHKSPFAAFAGALFYLLAILHKEIYAPLVFILLFFPCPGISIFSSRRLYTLLPCLAAAALYPFYRYWMLGVWLGGYGTLFESGPGVLHGLMMAGSMIWPDSPWMLVLLLIPACLGLLVFAKQSLQHALLAGSLLVGVIFPLTQLLSLLSTRHLFLPAFILILAAGYGLEAVRRNNMLWSRHLITAWMIIIFCSALFNHTQVRTGINDHADLITTQGRFIWQDGDKKDILLAQGIPEWYIGGLRELARKKEGRELRSRIILDVCNYFYVSQAPPPGPGHRVLRYDPGLQELEVLHEDYMHHKYQECMKNYYPDREIEALIHQDKASIRWNFGPYSTGSYALVSENTGGAYHLPAQGNIPGHLDHMLPAEVIYVCYTHPEDWHTCRKLHRSGQSFKVR